MSRTRRGLVAVLISIAIVGAACDSGGDDGGGETSGPATPLEVTAVDIAFEPSEVTVPAGTVEITLVQEGEAPHNLVVMGRPDIRLEVAANDVGDTDTQTYEIESGPYTFFCDVPGHRDAGMEGTLTVTGT